MKKTIILLTALFLGTTFMAANAQGDRKKVESTAAEVKSRGANPEIKGERPSDDKIEKSASRGSGSGTCYVYLHNYTAYSIDIYVDGYWKGTLGAYADSYAPTGTGYTSLYGMSVGKTKEWKFSGANCNSTYDYYFY